MAGGNQCWQKMSATRHLRRLDHRSILRSATETKAEESNKVQPDWAQVQELYHHDQIVTLKVTGSNRGGLLVEGEGLYGFVPFSHLVEMAGRNDTPDREKILGCICRSIAQA